MHVYESPHPRQDVPQLDLLSLLFDSDWSSAKEDTVLHACADNPHNAITKAEARELIRRIAYVLRHRFNIGSQGAGKDAVLVTSSPCPFLPIIFYGIVAAGGIYCGASHAATAADLTRQAKDSGSKLLICSSDREAANLAVAKACQISRDRVLVLDDGSSKNWKLLLSGTDVLQSAKSLDWARPTDLHTLESTTICLLYSSGTTGLPKGVRLSQRNLVAGMVLTETVTLSYRSRRRQQGRPFEYRTIAYLPMAHIAGLMVYAIWGAYLGGPTYWMRQFDINRFIASNGIYQATCQLSVPPVWLMVAKSQLVTSQFDSLEIPAFGAAPMGAELEVEVLKKLGRGKVAMHKAFGMTESTGTIACTDWEDHATVGTVGNIMSGIQMRIVDDNDRDVAPGETGELLFKGPVICQGYHNNPQATAESFLDGFWRTGDIGYIKDGLLRIVDRKKELIKYKGYQVAPAELEDVLLSHPKVLDAAVVGILSQKETEIPKAFVVVKGGEEVSEQEIVDFVKSHVANYKQLRGGVEFVDQIPKSASGKILRRELRARLVKAML